MFAKILIKDGAELVKRTLACGFSFKIAVEKAFRGAFEMEHISVKQVSLVCESSGELEFLHNGLAFGKTTSAVLKSRKTG